MSVIFSVGCKEGRDPDSSFHCRTGTSSAVTRCETIQIGLDYSQPQEKPLVSHLLLDSSSCSCWSGRFVYLLHHMSHNPSTCSSRWSYLTNGVIVRFLFISWWRRTNRKVGWDGQNETLWLLIVSSHDVLCLVWDCLHTEQLLMVWAVVIL